ncbi:MAG: hypothetical protein Q8K34_03480 [Hydrogenophaga sp.]|nr:hypothetical protein [Hydrogenophaga sp.]
MGKLGIVRDPFGLQGQPTYLGATLPRDGYGIINLSLSEDGRVLLGQLKGSFGVDIFQSIQNPHLNQAWNVEQLLKAALAHPDGLRQHIELPSGTEQLIQVPANAVGWVAPPAGTVFDPEPIVLKFQGNVGDVIEIKLREKVLEQLAKEKIQGATILTTTISFDVGDHITFAAPDGFVLLGDAKDQIGSTGQGLIGGSGKDQTFDKTGVLYVIPNLNSDMEKLRTGQRVNDKFSKLTFIVSYKDAQGTTQYRCVVVELNATDAQHGVFFGDRPTNNPGYSNMALSADARNATAMNLGNNLLDAAKIEQRLKYLGFGKSQVTSAEIKVDGKISKEEEAVMRLFNELVNNQSDYLKRSVIDAKTGKVTTTSQTAYSVQISDLNNWLNAYNAPHWMTFAGTLKGQLSGWTNESDWVDQDTYLTSWVSDLMLAAQQNNQALKADDPLRRSVPLWFKGAGTLGNRLDLGINTNHISPNNQARVNGKDQVLGVIPSKADGSTPNAEAYKAGNWNLANAKALTGKLFNPTEDPEYIGGFDNAAGNNLQDQALLDFLSVYSVTQKAGSSDPSKANGFWESINLKYATGGYKAGLFGDGNLIDNTKILLGGTAATLGSAMTAESLAAFMGNAALASYYQQWLEPLKMVMAEYQINTPSRIAAFLAQIKQESKGMTDIEEDLGSRSFYALWGIRSMFLKLDSFAAGQVVDTRVPENLLTAPEISALDAANKRLRTTQEAFFYNLKQFYEGSDAKELNSSGALAAYRMSENGTKLVVIATGQEIDFSSDAARKHRPNTKFTDEVSRKWANRYLSHDYGNGLKDDKGVVLQGNGTWNSQTASNWLGRGLKQVTHVVNYSKFFLHLAETRPQFVPEFQGVPRTVAAFEAKLLNEPSIARRLSQPNTAEGRLLATLSAAWFWEANKAGSNTLNDQALKILWSDTSVDSGQQAAFGKISKGIGGTEPDKRWVNYQNIVSKVLKGGNPYENLTAAMDRLGIVSTGKAGYQSVIGFSLINRQLTSLPANLLEANIAQDNEGKDRDFIIERDVKLASQVDLTFEKLKKYSEEVIMLPLNLSAGMVIGATLLSATLPVQASQTYAVGRCQVVQGNMPLDISPEYDAFNYVNRFLFKDPNFSGVDFSDENSKVTLVIKPKFGSLKLIPNQWGDDWMYQPGGIGGESTYVGRDNFVVEVKNKGISILVHYFIEVVGNDPTTYIGDNGERRTHEYCKYETWKISQIPDSENSNFLPTWQTQSHLSTLLAAASGVRTELADLPGTALGLHEGGSGWNARITLDSNAAGHGWYVDATPWSVSDDYLPTSDPNLWLAKPGSGAEGKMDLLSVWLHELGHAAGLDHTASGAGLMGATLLPGQRRRVQVAGQR